MASPYPTVPPPLPPPPPVPLGAAGESRATAATWVAATGALLLLAAAATFLAVSWDTLGLTARVAVVATVTGGAILGGHRLRRRLPAVGAVVYHLGALLVPVDVLGLALQTGLPPAGRWLAVGLAAAVALPPLAVIGRSPVLAWAAIAGLGVAATGLGLAGPVDARLIVIVAALLALALPQVASGRLAPVGRGAAPALAALTVHLPAVVAAVLAVPGADGVVRDLSAAGWVPGDWATTVTVGVGAVVVIAVAASRAVSERLAALTALTAVTTVVTALLPAGTPRLALLVVPALGAVAVELAALLARSDRLWAAPTAWSAAVVELVGLAVAVGATAIALAPAQPWRTAPDHDLAVMLGAVAVAWAVAAWRHGLGGGWDAALAPALTGVVGIHLTALLVVAGAGGTGGALLLLGTAIVTLRWSGLASPHVAGAVGRVAVATAAVLLAAAGVRAHGSVVAVVVPLAVAGVIGGHLRGAIRTARAGMAALIATMTPIAVTLVLLTGAAVNAPASGTGRFAGVLVALALLTLAGLVDPSPVASDAVRGVAALVGLTVVLPGWPVAPPPVGTAVDALVPLLGLGAEALVPALLVTTWLGVDAVRLRRPRIGALAAPVAVRLVAAGALAAGLPLHVAGALLWAGGVAAAVVAALGPRRWMVATAVAAGVAVPTGWLLTGDHPALRAGLLVATGAVGAGAGALRRRPGIGHAGAAVATLGIWQLLALNAVVTADVWLLPVAVQLWAAGVLLRRREGASSWLTDVPPLLLVTVPALAERLAGGPGWHAVLAGGLALAAVTAGGAERLGGPLFVGTLLLIAVVGIETFAVVAAVPTWAWLAVGGTTLLGAAVAIERAGGSPTTTARRLLEVVTERFD